VNDPYATHPLGGLWQQITVASSKDVNLITACDKVFCKLPNVDILTAAIDSAKYR
jgi:hypothetical protein